MPTLITLRITADTLDATEIETDATETWRGRTVPEGAGAWLDRYVAAVEAAALAEYGEDVELSVCTDQIRCSGATYPDSIDIGSDDLRAQDTAAEWLRYAKERAFMAASLD